MAVMRQTDEHPTALHPKVSQLVCSLTQRRTRAKIAWILMQCTGMCFGIAGEVQENPSNLAFSPFHCNFISIHAILCHNLYQSITRANKNPAISYEFPDPKKTLDRLPGGTEPVSCGSIAQLWRSSASSSPASMWAEGWCVAAKSSQIRLIMGLFGVQTWNEGVRWCLFPLNFWSSIVAFLLLAASFWQKIASNLIICLQC